MNVSDKTNDRCEQIVAWVDEYSYLSVNQIGVLCHSSDITIRRDLVKLAHQKRIRRTHGGAASLLRTPEIPGAITITGEDGHEPVAPVRSDQPLFYRLDALITADLLPKFAGLMHKSGSKKHLPVIAESLPLADTETCVTVDNYQAGFDLGCWAGDYALTHWAGQARVLDLTYHRPNTAARSQGFLEGLHSLAPAAELVFSINTQSRYDMAYQLTRDALSVHSNINLIFAMNDTSARGACDACTDLGISRDQLIILTFGVEGPAMIDLVAKGEWIRAAVCMFPEIVSAICIEAAIAAYNHQALPAQLVTPYCITTPETLSHLYERTSAGWCLRWQTILDELCLPLPLNPDAPDTHRPLPRRLGFIYTFVEHDWYKSLAHHMTDYAGKLGIHLELLDFEQTQKDELNLRRNEIARRAASEVKPGDTIFIDAGSISRELAEQLRDRQQITVITNAMPVLEALKDSPGNLTLISTGGAFRRASQSFVGPPAEAMLKEFRIDKLFLMASGVSKNFGISHTNISEVTIKQLMLRAAREVILLADYTCFQQEALIQVAPITMVHKIITDDALPASIRLELGALGISVILAAM
ncbi:MAG TPA: substrate-binding domain-containing protein [Anaerolineaceae bacterium]